MTVAGVVELVDETNQTERHNGGHNGDAVRFGEMRFGTVEIVLDLDTDAELDG